MPQAPRRVLSHWHHLVPDFNTSALAFYDSVEELVKATEAPDLEFSRVEWSEKGIFSAKRTYLRISRGRLNFDICAAPYGKGQFFSWWLAETPSYAALGYLVLLGVALFVASLFFLAVADGCGAIFFVVCTWLAGLPIGLYLLGTAVEAGTFGDEEAVLATPILGRLYEIFWNPHSYYRLDTAAMFQETVRREVGEAVNDLLSGQGLQALSGEVLRPHFERMRGKS